MTDKHRKHGRQDGTLSIEEIQKGIAESAVEIPQDLIEIMPLGKNLRSVLNRYENNMNETKNETKTMKDSKHQRIDSFLLLGSVHGVLPQFFQITRGMSQLWRGSFFKECGHLIVLSLSQNIHSALDILYSMI